MIIKIKRLLRKIVRKVSLKVGPPIINKITNNKPIKKDLIIFESFFGRSISDNPLGVYNMLDKEKYDCVFLVNDPKAYKNYKVIRRNTLKSYYYMRTAKIIVTNQRMPKYWIKKEEQTLIQTWHGTPLKKLVHDLETFNMPSADSLESYTAMFDKDVAKWDYMLSSCDYTSKCFKSAFKFNGNLLEVGFPRNEKLYHYKDTDINIIKEKLNIPLDKKVILYAPTYREDQNFGIGQYYFNTPLEFDKLKQAFPDHIILIRYHYIITETDDAQNENVINVSKYPDISDLYLISDLLITDYSSVFFDYSILKKPFLFFAYDIEKYANDLRGFYLDMYQDFPVQPVQTTEQLIEQIKNIDNYDFSSFSEKYNPIKNKNCKKEVITLVDSIMEK